MPNVLKKSRRERLAAFQKTLVYPVVSSEFCSREVIETVRQILAAGAGIVQLREKRMPARDFLAYARACRTIADEFGALIIIDDHVDIALAANADGVHLGQEDLPVAAARALAPQLILGVSTHNEAEIADAQAQDCDYLNIGPIFETQTKEVQYPAVGQTELERLIPKIKIPFSVMGGIKAQHVPALRKIGVKHIAAVTAFTQAGDIAQVLAQFS
ncbi:MAG: thiamine phosphate synthase [Opitutales bacterium]|nr:thiamine phosphate synthase [Opitutales bacterium]